MGIRIPPLSPLATHSTEHAPGFPVEISAKSGLLHRCGHCSRRILFGGYADGGVRYCSISCFTAGPFQGFCHVCTTTTTDEAPGSTTLYKGIGTTLRPRDQRCTECHSVLTREWFVLFLIPIVPLKEYRVRWTNNRTYVGRLLHTE